MGWGVGGGEYEMTLIYFEPKGEVISELWRQITKTQKVGQKGVSLAKSRSLCASK